MMIDPSAKLYNFANIESCAGINCWPEEDIKMIEVVADLAGRIVTIGRYSNRNSVINHTVACLSANWICLYSR